MPTERQVSTRSKFYARIGNHGWRGSGYDTFGFRSPSFRKWLGSQLRAKKASILSIGCGAGEVEGHLAASGHDIVGLDLSHAMLKRASRNGLDLAVRADARLLPFGSARFDVAMLIESIGYLELEEVFREARRVLKTGGRLMITSYPARVDAHARYRKWPIDEVMAQLIGAGFAIDECRNLDIKKSGVRDAPSEGRAMLFYLSSSRER
jgi:ubiquinone/menaquinone biosynthesis C-methylase UbiE